MVFGVDLSDKQSPGVVVPLTLKKGPYFFFRGYVLILFQGDHSGKTGKSGMVKKSGGFHF